jgi:NAD(P)H-nitrite reductase large subunit
MTIEKLLLRNEKFFKEHDINIILNTKVIGVDPTDKLIKLSTGEIKVYYLFI